MTHLDNGGALHEGQADFRVTRGCIYTLNELVQGRLKEGKDTYAMSRKSMIQCGVMACGLRCGILE